MTKTAATILILSFLFVPAACKRRRVAVQTTEEEAPLATIIQVADPRASSQLVNGFYGVEQNAWRWTAGRFAVMLRPPRSGPTRGATLQLKFTIPDVSIAKLKTVALSATLNGTPLTPESYTQAGQFTYSRDVPGNLLAGESVRVDFALDKTIPPNAQDKRELGVIVSVVGFEAK